MHQVIHIIHTIEHIFLWRLGCRNRIFVLLKISSGERGKTNEKEKSNEKIFYKLENILKKYMVML